MCIFHKYKYHGHVAVIKYLGGGGWKPGIPYETIIETKRCEKCGKLKEIGNDSY